MAKELINPNWHVVLVHFPIGVFMMGMLLEVAFLVLRHHGPARAAARWMIVLGALAGLPTAYAGAYALSDVARRTAPTVPDDAPWHAVAVGSSLNADQWEMTESHVWTSGGIAVIAALVVTLAVACSDRWRDRLYPLFLLLLLGCAAYIGVGAWYGGEMVYREGIAVKLPYKQDEARPATQPAAVAASSADSPAAETQTEKPAGLDYYVNPLQTHVTLAGVAAAMGLLGIGLALRAASTSPHWQDPELQRAGLTAMPNRQRGGADDLAVLRSFAPQVEVTGEVERIPVGRFWLLTFLVTVLASLAGWWTLADETRIYRPADLWNLVNGEGYVRRLAHVVGAGAVILLPLFMSLLARFARRSRGTIAIFGMLLVLAIAAQVWMGVLLMYDQPKVGTGVEAWYRFQAPASASDVAARATSAP